MHPSLLRSLAVCVLSIVVGLPLTTAEADALSPPPLDCPAGTLGRSARSGGYCAPTRCGEGEEGCPREPFCPVHSWPCPSPEPWQCEEAPRGLCVRTSTSHGVRPGPRGPIGWTDERTEALGPCASDADCSTGARCEQARRCAHAPAPPASPAPTSAPSAPPPATLPTLPAAPAAAPPAAAPPRANEPSSTMCASGRRPGAHTAWLAAALAAVALARRRSRLSSTS